MTADGRDALVGRSRELGLIGDFLDRAAADGGALVVIGDPGVGKTALLGETRAIAVTAGTGVLAAAGVESEADVTFSGLHQTLLPLHDEIADLGGAYRDALNVALGFGDGPPPDRLLVANATLTLLLQAARARPLLLIIDDLPWLDRTSAVVLSMVARRLEGSRVGLLAASRNQEESFFEQAGLPTFELGPLDENAAGALMSARYPALAPAVRARLLTEAEGNPLAVLELPAALTGHQRAAMDALPRVLPLTRRLRALFRSRVGALPVRSRWLLLLIALGGTGDVRLLHAVGPAGQGFDDLAAAEAAGLAFLDPVTHRLTFRHPLIRSAVVDLSTVVERRAAHQALAEVWAEQPERRAWHLAEAAVREDEEIAGLLEHVGRRTLGRGDGVGAVNTLVRAAELSPDAGDRARRLALAAYVGADVTGDLRSAAQLLTDAREATPELGGSLQAAVAASYVLLNGDGDVDTAHRLLVAAMKGHPDSEAVDGALEEALHTLTFVCFFGARPELWTPFYEALGRLEPRVPTALYLASKMFADPVRTAAPALPTLEAAIDGLAAETDPTQIVRVAIAAVFVDRIGRCRDALWRVVRDGREGGAVASAIQALIMLAHDDYLSGQWDEAGQLADEAVALCEAHGYQMFAWPGREVQAILAAARGDAPSAQAVTDRMIEWAAPRGIGAVHGYASSVRTLTALARGDFEEAYEQATAIGPAGTLASHRPDATWVAMDLVEAAVHTGRRPEADAHVTAMRDCDIAALSPRLALLAAGSTAIAAPADRCLELFARAMTTPGAERWPFDRARVQLAYGEQLRRARAITQARSELSAALHTFERLGARPWVDRTSHELRATGQTRVRGHTGEREALTPQELEIATLAASGLTNKQIGQRLFLSHRTVGAHLYRIFPKLGITSRAALRDALGRDGRPDRRRRSILSGDSTIR